MDRSIASVQLRQLENYRFELDFGGNSARTIGDEPAPLGTGAGPSPVQLLAAAVGNCICDSLLFAFRKYQQMPEPLRSEVQAQVGRNAEGRLRVLEIQVELHLGVPAATLSHLDRVLSSFEAYCTVSQSVAQGIPTMTRVFDSEGALLN